MLHLLTYYFMSLKISVDSWHLDSLFIHIILISIKFIIGVFFNVSLISSLRDPPCFFPFPLFLCHTKFKLVSVPLFLDEINGNTLY